MRKYYIADMLTWGRLIVLSGLMVVAAFLPWPLWVGLVIYVVGVLSDGVDGSFAKRYKYPNDGKQRWWRGKKFVAILDEMADGVFGVCSLVFFIMRVNWVVGWWFLGIGLSFGIVGQIVLYAKLLDWWPGLRDLLVMLRRFLYVAALVVVLMLLTLATFPKWWMWLIVLGVYVAIGLLLLKLGMVHVKDRLKKASKE